VSVLIVKAICVAVGVLAAIVVARVRRAHTADKPDMGSVSHQWVAEHRIEPGHGAGR
jgi:hypothetical protein